MPGNQKNFSYFTYTDDSARDFNVRGESGGPFTGVDGHTAFGANPTFGKNSKRRHVRYVEATHAASFRKVRGIVYTPTAYAAIDIGDTIAVAVGGVTGTVNYLVSAKIPERQPGVSAPRQLAEI